VLNSWTFWSFVHHILGDTLYDTLFISRLISDCNVSNFLDFSFNAHIDEKSPVEWLRISYYQICYFVKSYYFLHAEHLMKLNWKTTFSELWNHNHELVNIWHLTLHGLSNYNRGHLSKSKAKYQREDKKQKNNIWFFKPDLLNRTN